MSKRRTTTHLSKATRGPWCLKLTAIWLFMFDYSNHYQLLSLRKGNPLATGAFPTKNQWLPELMHTLQWRHIGPENIKAPRHWHLWVTGEFPAQRASNAENVSIWWRHHAKPAFNVFKQQKHIHIRVRSCVLSFYQHLCQNVALLLQVHWMINRL